MDKNLEEIISDKLIRLRNGNRLTQTDVGRELNVHRETIRRYETHPLDLDVGIFIKMLTLYGVKPSNFFEEIYGK